MVLAARGASNAKVYAVQSIDADASGVASIHCQGRLKIQKRSDSMGSKVTIKLQTDL